MLENNIILYINCTSLEINFDIINSGTPQKSLIKTLRTTAENKRDWGPNITAWNRTF